MSGQRSRARRERAALVLAHELRTPLTALSLAADMLEDPRHGGLTTTQRELARTIAREAARLRLVVDQALRTDRLGGYAGPVERARLDLGRVVTEALRPLHAQARARGVAIVERAAHGAEVVGDPAKLAWVATSLVGNALRYSPVGGRIDVRVGTSGPRAELRVRDRGPGIAASRRRDVFGRDAGGTLFLVQEVLQAHGGAIRLGAVAVGSTFVVSLPLASPLAEVGPA